LSLQTGTELISLALAFNKAAGIYGILTLLTGYAISALQVSAYLGSILVLVALAFCVPHIRTQSPFHNLALAWLYVLDTIVSAAYTCAFATNWYSGEYSVSIGGDAALPHDGQVEQDASHTAQSKARSGVQDTAASIVLVIGFTLVRVYFSLVVMAYARTVLLRFVDENMGETEQADPTGEAPHPFAVGAPLGGGLRGKLGRLMVSIGKGYWLGGRTADEEWTRDVSSKFKDSRQ
jgi:hypothetical protein